MYIYLYILGRGSLARPKWGPVALKGLKTPDPELSAFSKDPAI